MDMFEKLQKETVKTVFEEFDEALIYRQPLLYCNFSAGIGDSKYLPVTNYADLYKILSEALDNHNELNAAMNLVLFEDAVSHVLRINRILEAPRGNALLIGVGGSGKQSLSRLAAFIAGLEVCQISLKKGYDVTDLKLDLAGLYQKAGTKNLGLVFLMTDAQVRST
jgi:dynein heavy chain